MKKYLRSFKPWFSLLCLCFTGCTVVGDNPVKLTVESYPTSSATMTVASLPVYTAMATSAETLPPTIIFSPTSAQIVLPAVTMSPKEAETALLELLKTNGNCKGKCIAGIQPDEMTVQDAMNKMAQWGTINIYENPNGKTFINLDQIPLYERVRVDLSIGTSTKKLETIDQMYFQMEGFSESYLGEDLWLANRDAWQGFRLDNILKIYGIPSYVGYFFQTNVEIGSSLEGRTILYGMEMHFEQINLHVHIGALAYSNGKNLLLCPSKDPHNLKVEINPERPLKELQRFYPVIWQELTGTNLDLFYQMFTTNSDTCVTTTLEQIQVLQPSFR